MIEAPEGFLLPSHFLSSLEAHHSQRDDFGHDGYGCEITPLWSHLAPNIRFRGKSPDLKTKDWYEMALTSAVSFGLFAWDRKNSPNLISEHMPCCGSFPKTLFFDAKMDLISSNRTNPLADKFGSEDLELLLDSIDLHRGYVALIKQDPANQLVSAILSGRWREFLNDKKSCKADFGTHTMPYPLLELIFQEKRKAEVQKTSQALEVGGQNTKPRRTASQELALEFFDLSNQEISGMGPKRARKHLEKKGIYKSDSTAKRAVKAEKERRGLK